MTDEKAEVLVRVRLANGAVETVGAFRAARLILAGEAEPELPWSESELRAVLEAHEQRQQAAARRLARDGLLPGEGQRRPVEGPWGWLAIDSRGWR